jgi:hypothetical protein
VGQGMGSALGPGVVMVPSPRFGGQLEFEPDLLAGKLAVNLVLGSLGNWCTSMLKASVSID